MNTTSIFGYHNSTGASRKQLAEFELFMFCRESMSWNLYMQINHFQAKVLSVNAVQDVMVSLYLLLNVKPIKYTDWPIIIVMITSHIKRGIFKLKKMTDLLWIYSCFKMSERNDSWRLASSINHSRLSSNENVEVDSKGFWRCCITLGITRIFVDVYRPVFHRKQLFGDWTLPAPPLPPA
jgi:hypothetical protein